MELGGRVEIQRASRATWEIGARRDEALRGGLPEDGRQRPRRGHGGRRDLLPDQAGDPLRGPPRQDVRGGRRGRAEEAVGDQVHRRHRRHRHGRGVALHRADGRRHGRHRLAIDRRASTSTPRRRPASPPIAAGSRSRPRRAPSPSGSASASSPASGPGAWERRRSSPTRLVRSPRTTPPSST